MKVLDLTLPTPAENLACDEALLDAAEDGRAGETLRFWESPEPFVVLGYANKLASEVHQAACEARGIPILRRCSGGGTVVQGPGCLNYALVLEIKAAGPLESIGSANQFIMQRNQEALEVYLHRPVQLSGHTDLAVGARKFSGNAQRRKRRFLLFHGTILLNLDLKLVSELLFVPAHQPAYRQNRPHTLFLINLLKPAAGIKEALRATWRTEATPAEVPAAEIARLVAEKYSRRDWNFKF